MVGDKTSMANSIEVRVPFLDRRLVEFIESLPPSLKLRGTTGKFLHKKALLKWLPRSDVYRPKKGFANPIGKWLRTSMRPLVDDCLLSGTSMIARHFDQRAVRAHRRGRPAGQGAIHAAGLPPAVARALAPGVHALNAATGSDMDVSIVIVNWNSKEFLVNCVRSIRRFPPRFSTS